MRAVYVIAAGIFCTLQWTRGSPLFDFFTSGITGPVWRHLRRVSNDTSSSWSNVSLKCQDSLAAASLSPYRLLDASSKPCGLSRGVIVSFGDYDACLKDIGQYCVVKFSVDFGQGGTEVATANSTVVREMRHLIPVIGFLQPRHALCLPDQCSQLEVQRILHRIFEREKMVKILHVNCQSQESISYSARIRKFTKSQTLALLFLVSIIFLTAWASLTHRRADPSEVIVCFDVRQNYAWLTSEPRNARTRSQVVDWMQVVFVTMGGVVMHSLFPLDHEDGLLLVGETKPFVTAMDDIDVRTIVNDAGIDMFFLLSGFSAYQFVVTRSGLSLPAALVTKVSRYLPAVLMMLSLDLLFGLWASGPMYEIIGQDFVHKCSHIRALSNIFMIQNVNSVVDNCGVQFYYSSIDCQCFVVTAAILFLTKKNMRIRKSVIWALIIVSLTLTSVSVFLRGTPENLIFANWRWPDIINYIDHVKHTTYSHLPFYLIGVLLAGSYDCELNRRRRLLISAVGLCIGQITTLSLPRILLLLTTGDPDPVIKNFIVAVYVPIRKLFLCLNTVSLIFASPLLLRASLSGKEMASPEKTATKKYPVLLSVMRRLAFTVFVVNMHVIRLDFYSSRHVSTTYPLNIGRRIAGNTFYVFVFAFAVHLLLIQPMDRLVRQVLFSSQRPVI